MSTWEVDLKRDGSGGWTLTQLKEWDKTCESTTFHNKAQEYSCRVVFKLSRTFGVNSIVVAPQASCTLMFQNRKVKTQYQMYDAEKAWPVKKKPPAKKTGGVRSVMSLTGGPQGVPKIPTIPPE